MLQLFLFSWLNLFHPFYVSVTEVVQDQKTKTVQVSVRVFFDDFEKALNNKYNVKVNNNVKVNILKPADRKQVDALIADYIKTHLQLKGNGKPLNLKYLGYEIQEDAAWCYFETEKTEPIQRLSIVNNILYEQHGSQINMIHAIVNGKRQSTKLDNPNKQTEFLWD